MDIAKQIEAAQTRANQLAIQESNLREQIAPLQMQQDQVIRAKHQALGEVAALMRLANEQAKETPAAVNQDGKRRGK